MYVVMLTGLERSRESDADFALMWNISLDVIDYNFSNPAGAGPGWICILKSGRHQNRIWLKKRSALVCTVDKSEAYATEMEMTHCDITSV